ncbi:hypothetical protein [Paracoccus sp. T5]|uniref:hypothetical protein n=1 Tax=Paracoccus sp. T5 TaxID=3402161 RepID=UPI003AE51491
MNDHTKIIDLNARVPNRLKRVTEDGIWERVCEDALRPTFELLGSDIEKKGRPTRTEKFGTDSYFTRPFMLLTWHGQKSLDGQQMALHFTYGGNGVLAFDLSAIKTVNGVKMQSSYTRRIFSVGDGELMTNVFHMSSMGLGYAAALEDMPAEPEWRIIRIPQNRMS